MTIDLKLADAEEGSQWYYVDHGPTRSQYYVLENKVYGEDSSDVNLRSFSIRGVDEGTFSYPANRFNYSFVNKPLPEEELIKKLTALIYMAKRAGQDSSEINELLFNLDI